jgi:hypothetical protein
MSNEPENKDRDDLSVEAEAFSAPAGGDAGEGAEDKGPVTVGTTCWGTPCPSANTVSC